MTNRIVGKKITILRRIKVDLAFFYGDFLLSSKTLKIEIFGEFFAFL